MTLTGRPTEMVRTDPREAKGQGDTWQEVLVTDVFWNVMGSGAIFYPFYTWIMTDASGNNELMFSYNGADYPDDTFEVGEASKPEEIAPKIIDLIRAHQG